MSDETVVRLPGVVNVSGAEADPSIVEVLEELLQRARAGEIRSLAVAFQDPGGSTTIAWHYGTASCYPLQAAVGRLFHRVFADACEGAENQPMKRA